MTEQIFQFDRITVANYRCLEDVAVDLRGLNVVIGPNGVGKSTFLDAFQLLAAATREGGLAEAVAQRGGFSRMASFVRREASLRLGLTSSPQPWPGGQVPAPITYTLELQAAGSGYAVASELLDQRRDPAARAPFHFVQRVGRHRKIHDPKTGALIDPEWPVADHETILSALVRTHAGPGQFRSRLGAATLFPPVPLDARSPLRLPQTLVPTASVPTPDGGNLLSVLQRVRAEHEDHWVQIEEALRAGFPTFRKLDWSVVAAGQVTLGWHDRRFKEPLFANDLSSGTLRFLHLATLLLCPEPPALMLIDEPELRLHPELLRILAALLRQAAERTQIVVATHSGSMLRWLEPDDVVVVESTDAGPTFTRGGAVDLDRWVRNFTLDAIQHVGLPAVQP